MLLYSFEWHEHSVGNCDCGRRVGKPMIMRSTLFAALFPGGAVPGTPAAASAAFFGLSDAGGKTVSKSRSLK